MKNHCFLIACLASVLILGNACKKDTISASSLYVPFVSDTTANATLAELQQGKTL